MGRLYEVHIRGIEESFILKDKNPVEAFNQVRWKYFPQDVSFVSSLYPVEADVQVRLLNGKQKSTTYYKAQRKNGADATKALKPQKGRITVPCAAGGIYEITDGNDDVLYVRYISEEESVKDVPMRVAIKCKRTSGGSGQRWWQLLAWTERKKSKPTHQITFVR